jgi:DNA-binding transcriptional LysR family regulator
MDVQKMRKVQFAELIEFVVVAQYRSFTRAAVQLGVSPPALSQTIRVVEDRLGLRLLNRTTRHVAPTPAGERLLERLRPIIEDLESAFEELNEYRDRPAGYLRLAIAPAAGHELGPILARFAVHYPDIKIEISADDGPADIISGGFDAGIQLGGLVADNMVAVRVTGEIRRVVVGAPAYFAQHRPPRTPEDLSEHNCIRLKTPSGRIDPWQFVRGRRNSASRLMAPSFSIMWSLHSVQPGAGEASCICLRIAAKRLSRPAHCRGSYKRGCRNHQTGSSSTILAEDRTLRRSDA